MTWGDAMKDIKEKPTAHMPRSNATGEIPKAALKKAWTEAKEKSRTMLRESTSTQGDGDYTAAQDTSSVVTDTSYSVIKQNTDFTASAYFGTSSNGKELVTAFMANSTYFRALSAVKTLSIRSRCFGISI